MRRPENSCWPGCELLGWLVVEAWSRASLAAVMGLEWRTTFVCIPTRGSGSIQAFVVMGSSFWVCDGFLCDVRGMTTRSSTSSCNQRGELRCVDGVYR